MARAANPGGRCETHLPQVRRPATRRPYSALLRVGFAVRTPLPESRCALTAPFHPCLIPGEPGPSAVCSLWHFPSACAGRALPATLVSWSPDFPRDRSHAAARPPGTTGDRARRRFRQVEMGEWNSDTGILQNSKYQFYSMSTGNCTEKLWSERNLPNSTAERCDRRSHRRPGRWRISCPNAAASACGGVGAGTQRSSKRSFCTHAHDSHE